MTQPGPAAAGRRELVHPRTRTAFRDACSDWGVLRQISRAFDDEGVQPMSDSDFFMAGQAAGVLPGGQRRGLFDRYTRRIDWSDPVQVQPVLQVFEQILTWAGDDHDGRDRLVDLLQRDGFRVDQRGRIRDGAGGALAELPLKDVSDPAAIREHLDRIAEAADRDPPLAISGARALVEATTKVVLHELGEPVDEKADVPALVKQAQKALGLHPDVLAPDTKGAEPIKRIFSALSQLAVCVAELRNLYGSDHGRSKATTGLGPRHAHLAVGAATVYCRTLLETLEARAIRAGGTPR